MWIDENYLWFTNNRFHAFAWFAMNFNSEKDINFGIYRIKLEQGTKSYMNAAGKIVKSNFNLFMILSLLSFNLVKYSFT